VEYKIATLRIMEGDKSMRRFNLDEFLCFVVFVLLDIWIFYLAYTGKIDFYIGKKMLKYIYITVVMLSIIAFFQIQKIFTLQRNSKLKLKLLPIILTIILGIISINKQETFKHNQLNNEIKESNLSNIDMKYLYEHEIDYDIIQEQNNKKEILIINEDNPMLLEDIRVNSKKYIGRKLEIHGFICKENYLNKNQFIIGRLVMNCCAADSRVIGIVGEYDKVNNIYENEKIIANGNIGITTIKDNNNVTHKIPVLIIENLKNENVNKI
jgi:putative membrane protein